MTTGPLSQLDTTLQAFRAALIRRDAAVLAIVDRRWRVIQRMLLDESDALLAQIAAAKNPSTSWLRRLRRYQNLLTQVEALTAAYATGLAPTIAAGQETAITLASEHAVGLVRAQVGEVAWNTLPAGQVTELIGRLSGGLPLADYLAGFGKTAATAAEEALLGGMATGKGVRVIAGALAQVFGVKDAVDPGLIGRKALLTAHGAVLGSYRSASLESYKANRDVVKRWRWRCARTTRTCLICWSKDGQEFDLAVPFESHVFCRCSPQPVTATFAELGIEGIPEPQRDRRTGPEIFAALSAEDRLTILGPSRERLWNAGVPLEKMVAKTQSAVWGDGLRQRNLREIVRNG